MSDRCEHNWPGSGCRACFPEYPVGTVVRLKKPRRGYAAQHQGTVVDINDDGRVRLDTSHTTYFHPDNLERVEFAAANPLLIYNTQTFVVYQAHPIPSTMWHRLELHRVDQPAEVLAATVMLERSRAWAKLPRTFDQVPYLGTEGQVTNAATFGVIEEIQYDPARDLLMYRIKGVLYDETHVDLQGFAAANLVDDHEPTPARYPIGGTHDGIPIINREWDRCKGWTYTLATLVHLSEDQIRFNVPDYQAYIEAAELQIAEVEHQLVENDRQYEMIRKSRAELENRLATMRRDLGKLRHLKDHHADDQFKSE